MVTVLHGDRAQGSQLWVTEPLSSRTLFCRWGWSGSRWECQQQASNMWQVSLTATRGVCRKPEEEEGSAGAWPAHSAIRQQTEGLPFSTTSTQGGGSPWSSCCCCCHWGCCCPGRPPGARWRRAGSRPRCGCCGSSTLRSTAGLGAGWPCHRLRTPQSSGSLWRQGLAWLAPTNTGLTPRTEEARRMHKSS